MGNQQITLDAVLEALAGNKVLGVNICDLEPKTIIEIKDISHAFTVVVADPVNKKIVIKDNGKYFPNPVWGTLTGSTFGGSIIVLGFIGMGLCMEVSLENGSTLTTAPMIAIRAFKPPDNILADHLILSASVN